MKKSPAKKPTIKKFLFSWFLTLTLVTLYFYSFKPESFNIKTLCFYVVYVGGFSGIVHLLNVKIYSQSLKKTELEVKQRG